MNLLSKLRDLTSTSIALLKVAGALHRQARALESSSKHQAALTARLDQLLTIQESRLRLELLRHGATELELAEEYEKLRSPKPETVKENLETEKHSPSYDLPPEVLGALANLAPGSLEEREILALAERGGTLSEFDDLLAQLGLGGRYTGALSLRDANDVVRLDGELLAQEKNHLAQIEAAAKELQNRARGLPTAGPAVTAPDVKGDQLGGASFG